jgi:hypothetical protein
MDLNERLDHYPEAWKPEPGDKILGRVLSISVIESKFGGSYPLVELVTDDDTEIAVHGFHTVLKSELARVKPRPGDMLGIKFFGKDDKVDYLRYRVLLERAEPSSESVDWDAVAAEATEELDGVPVAADDPPPPTDADAPARVEW